MFEVRMCNNFLHQVLEHTIWQVIIYYFEGKLIIITFEMISYKIKVIVNYRYSQTLCKKQVLSKRKIICIGMNYIDRDVSEVRFQIEDHLRREKVNGNNLL